MNRLFTLLYFLCLLAAVPAFAGAPDQGKQQPSSQEDEAVKHLEGTVEVSFRIDKAGKVEIVNMNATNPQLADYVIKKLNKIKLEKGDPQAGKIIKYRFVFRKQA